MAKVTIRELLEAGVHFGHQTRRWNPKMRPYIYGQRDGISIEWDDNGTMRNMVEFKEGKRNGRTQRWDAEGNLELDHQFLGGEPVETNTEKGDSETAKDDSDQSDAEK